MENNYTLEEAIVTMNNTHSADELCDMVLLARELVEREYQKNKDRILKEKGMY